MIGMLGVNKVCERGGTGGCRDVVIIWDGLFIC